MPRLKLIDSMLPPPPKLLNIFMELHLYKTLYLPTLIINIVGFREH